MHTKAGSLFKFIHTKGSSLFKKKVVLYSYLFIELWLGVIGVTMREIIFFHIIANAHENKKTEVT